jgi:hypothetical protein
MSGFDVRFCLSVGLFIHTFIGTETKERSKSFWWLLIFKITKQQQEIK